MRQVLLPLSLALLCVLAGCNGLAPGLGDGGEVPDVEPADVPRDMYGGTVAPGLTEHEVVNASALMRAHASVVENRSVTVDQRRYWARGDEVRQNSTVTYRYDPDAERQAVESDRMTGRGSDVGIRLWTNDSTTVVRERRGGRTLERRQSRDGGWHFPSGHTGQLWSVLDGARDVSVSALATEGEYDRYRVDVLDGREGTTEFVVDERGFVSEYTVNRSTRADEVDRTSVELTDVGRTDVGRPGWVDDALSTIAAREYVAPGVVEDRVVDTNALRQAHRESLRNESVTVVREDVRRTVDGDLLDRTAERDRLSADRERYYRNRTSTSRNRTWETHHWSNGSVGYSRQVSPEGDVSYPEEVIGNARSAPTPSFSTWLPYAEETTVTELDDGRYRVEATGVPGYDTGARPAASSDASVSFVVGEEGFVETYEESYVRDEGDRTIRGREELRYRDRGETTVPTPGWLSEAADERPVVVEDDPERVSENGTNGERER
ncbi:hypothetical protein [Halomarina ordinaria]|uniref:Outer membrane lipoprotein carrier protein LolA n=1 Tax=Halomarina ordinaria TaxID=3033939 RepID=A0ABD5U995_9EURY|nr:hypothetical protein [Halomarina sp. PSRA2]